MLRNLLNKLLLRFVLALFAGLFFINPLKAQYFTTGQDPFSVKWLQVNTNHFRLIFPEKFTPRIVYLAGILDESYRTGTFSLNNKPKKIPVLLHTHTVISNGMVAWAPKRMELFSLPPQDNLSSKWIEHLVIHEFRHVVQIDKFNQGFTKLLGLFIGQQAAIGVVGLHVPLWFMEGDAVLLETTMTGSGRGRDPAFEMELRSQLLEKGPYSYDKAVFGSYIDYVPNHYKLGYFLVAGTRDRFGSSAWENTLNYVARKPYKISAFSKGLKENTGYTKTGLYKLIMNDLEERWKIQKSLSYGDIDNTFSSYKNDFINYISGHYIDENNIIAEKKGIDDIDRFVKINKDGKEEIVFTPGWYFKGSMSYANNLIVWTEIQPDLRWGQRSWSVIKSYNIINKEYKQISKKSRYFSPAISPDGNTIAAVELDLLNNCRIVLIDYTTGQTISYIDIPEGLFVMTPSWNTKANNLAVILQNENGKCLGLIDIQNNKIIYLTDFNFVEISNPFISGNKIVFTGAWSGINNIFSLDLITKEISQITSEPFGAEYPVISPDNSKILFSSYNSVGYDIKTININNTHKIPLRTVADNSIKVYKNSILQEKYHFNTNRINTSNYKPVKYSRLKNLFNIHSWAPLGINLNNMTVNPGVSFLSQNVLGTMTADAGYGYNLIEGTGNYFANITYMGFYPVLKLNMETGKRKINHVDEKGNSSVLRWKENSISFKISQPLNFTNGKYSRGIRPGITLDFKDIEYILETPDNWSYGKIHSVELSFLAYNNLKRSSKDLYPKWGQVFGLSYKGTPLDKYLSGSVFSVEGALFFPGIIKHHSLRIYAGYQNKVTEDYTFIDNIPYPRSIYGETNDRLLTFRSDYKLPLMYPDFSVPGIVYIKRIKLGVFNDISAAMHEEEQKSYWSTGIELTSDLHLFRFKAPLDIGFRLSYQPNNQKLKFELLYQLNVYGI